MSKGGATRADERILSGYDGLTATPRPHAHLVFQPPSTGPTQNVLKAQNLLHHHMCSHVRLYNYCEYGPCIITSGVAERSLSRSVVRRHRPKEVGRQHDADGLHRVFYISILKKKTFW